MAKEVQILFVYDTQKTYEDDALGPILYFHPAWVPHDQKAALCGQIVGTIQCMKNIFSKPDIISLCNGKFVIIEHRKFLFVMGTDKDTPSAFLNQRAKSLYSLIEFYHNDFESLQTKYASKTAAIQLREIIDAYLKILMISGKIFSQKQTFVLSKSSNDIFTQAVHILECCKSCNSVLGGILSYRNRLVATQLNSSLAHLLLLTEACKVTCPARVIKPQFRIPREARLYEVFISADEYSKLNKSLQENEIFQKLPDGIVRKDSKETCKKEDRSVLSAMKREQSLLFTSVPEESYAPAIEQFQPKKSRPRFLNLENAAPKINVCKNLKHLDELNSAGGIIVRNASFQETKKIVHFNPLSICHNEENQPETNKLTKKIPPTDKKKSLPDRKYYKTIADPTFPVFKRDGRQISYSFYEESEKKRCLDDQEIFNKICRESPDRFDSHRANNYSLPPYNNGVLSNSTSSTFISGMLKRSSSFLNYKSKGNTALDNKKTIPRTNFDCQYKKSTKSAEKCDQNAMQRCVLFQWNENDIAITLLAKSDICQDQEAVTAVCEICANHLGKLENKMRYSMESQNMQEGEPYKFMTLDSTVTGNLWNGSSDNWRELHYFNDEFCTTDITEILIRSSDTMYYGYHCGPNKIFYSEAANCNGGLPLPADPMGVLQIKAKRRLERDYQLILF